MRPQQLAIILNMNNYQYTDALQYASTPKILQPEISHFLKKKKKRTETTFTFIAIILQ